MQQRHAATVERQLAGTWKLVSLSREFVPNGKPAPERPRGGFLNFAPGNRVMTIVVPLDRKAPAEMFPTDALDGRRLTLKTEPSRNTADGQDSVYTQVWEKVG